MVGTFSWFCSKCHQQIKVICKKWWHPLEIWEKSTIFQALQLRFGAFSLILTINVTTNTALRGKFLVNVVTFPLNLKEKHHSIQICLFRWWHFMRFLRNSTIFRVCLQLVSIFPTLGRLRLSLDSDLLYSNCLLWDRHYQKAVGGCPLILLGFFESIGRRWGLWLLEISLCYLFLCLYSRWNISAKRNDRPHFAKWRSFSDCLRATAYR